jgi:hypothetical protein
VGAAAPTPGWRVIAQGTTIGRKRIVRVVPTRSRALRIEVLDARAEPLISSVAAHLAGPDALPEVAPAADGGAVGAGGAGGTHK